MGGCFGKDAGGVDAGECMLDGQTRVGRGAREGACLAQDYKLKGPILGFGRTATVREAVEVATGRHVAVKACSKKHLSARPARISRTSEIEALLRVRSCPHVVDLVATYEDRQHLFLVLSLAEGGDLFHYVAGRESLLEADVRTIAKQVLEAVCGCHANGVVHRDLKPENILLAEGVGGLRVEVVDFGSAAVIPRGEGGGGGAVLLRDFMGTAFYCAPEVWAQAYGAEADLWSVGAVLYVLLTGALPSPALTRATVVKDATWQALQKGQAPDLPASISQDARGLLLGLLHPEPERRLTASQALTHTWFIGGVPPAATPLEGSIRGFRNYAAIRQVRQVVVALLSVLLSPSQTEALLAQLKQPPAGVPPSRDDASPGVDLDAIEAALLAEGLSSEAKKLRSATEPLSANSAALRSCVLFQLDELQDVLHQLVSVPAVRGGRRRRAQSRGRRTGSLVALPESNSSGWLRLSQSPVGGDAGLMQGLLGPSGRESATELPGRAGAGKNKETRQGPRDGSGFLLGGRRRGRHTRSALELSGAALSSGGPTPSPSPGGWQATEKGAGERQALSVHGERLYSAFLRLGSES